MTPKQRSRFLICKALRLAWHEEEARKQFIDDETLAGEMDWQNAKVRLF